jgi:hypothetical protein
VNDWLTYELSTQLASTIAKHRSLATTHVIPSLGARKYRDLRAEDHQPRHGTRQSQA